MARRAYNSPVKSLPVLTVAVAVLLLSLAARASTVFGYSDILSRAQASSGADHRIRFVTPGGVNAPTESISLTFGGLTAPTFNLSAITAGDVDLGVDTSTPTNDCVGPFAQETVAASAAAGVWGAAVSGQVLTLTPPTNATSNEIPSGACLEILVGTNASTGGTGTHQIVNPSAVGSYTLQVAGGFPDDGQAFLAISDSDQVSISASVPSHGGGGGGGGGGQCTASLSNIRAENVGESTADIKWDSDIAATSAVDYGLTNAYGSSSDDASYTFNHSLSLSGLAHCSTYHYRVRSTSTQSCQASSTDQIFTTDDVTAPVISNVHVTGITGTSATITWDTDEDATSRVDYGPTRPFTFTIDDSSLTNAHTVTLTGLNPGTPYFFTVNSRDCKNNTTTSGELSFTTGDTVPPTISGVHCDAVTTSGFRVNWATDELADSRVDYGPSLGYGQDAENSNLVANHQITVTGLAAQTSYHYKVTSVDTSSNSSVSGDFICTTSGDTVPPANVSGFTAIACSEQVTLSWSNPGDDDFQGTRIQRSTATYPTSPNGDTNIYDAGGASYVDTGLTNGVQQFYTAFAHDTSGNFASGAVADATPSTASSPLCPAPPPVCGNHVCESPEDATSCATDCQVTQPCYDCSRFSYDVYLINPDLGEKHMGTAWVRVTDEGDGRFRVGFEDATLDPEDPNFDYNDAVVEVDARDCGGVKFTMVSSNAGLDHQLRVKAFIDGDEKADVLLWASTKSNVGTTRTIDFGTYVGSTCPVPPRPVQCGNGQCESGENSGNCSADCPAPPPLCGNAVCDAGETHDSCANDCPAPPPPPALCGNNACESTETHDSCPADCPVPPPPPPPVTPPTQTASGSDSIDRSEVRAFAERRTLLLHKDDAGRYHVLPSTSFSIIIPKSALPHPTTLQVLNLGSASYLFKDTADGQSIAADADTPGATGIIDGVVILTYDDGLTDDIPFKVSVDGYGLVYQTISGQRIPIEGATVTVYLMPGQSTPWDASPYFQANPVLTKPNGLIGWMVPPGTYRIKIDKDGFRPVNSAKFVITTEVLNPSFEMIAIPKNVLDVIVPGASVTENIGNVNNALAAQGAYVVQIVSNEVVQNATFKRATTSIVVPAVAIVATTVLATAVQLSSLISYLYFLITQPILLLGRRKRKEYGVVYNALTKMPVDLAIVRLYRISTAKLVRTLVTDKQGRYAFLVDPGEYRIEASKPGYVYPTVYLRGRREDSRYLDLYHDEPIEVGEKGAIIAANIPIDPIETNKTASRIIWEEIGRRAQNILSLVSVIVTIVAALLYRQPFLYLLVLIQIGLFLLFRRLARPKRPKNWGIVYDATTKKPIPFAVARIVESQYNKTLESRVTDSQGRYNFLVGNSKYYVTAEKPGYEASKSGEIDLTEVGKEGGVVNADIGLKTAEKKTLPKPETPAAIPPSDLGSNGYGNGNKKT